MGVVFAHSYKEEMLTSRLLRQLRRYRGDQTDKPLIIFEEPVCEPSWLELQQDHGYHSNLIRRPRLKQRAAPAFMVDTWQELLAKYPQEKIFLQVDPDTYFIKPPHIQLPRGFEWGGVATKYAHILDIKDTPLPIIHGAYRLTTRTFIEQALEFCLKNPPGLSNMEFYYSYNKADPVDRVINYDTVIAYIAGKLKMYPDTSLRNQLALTLLPTQTLQRDLFRLRAVHPNRRSL